MKIVILWGTHIDSAILVNFRETIVSGFRAGIVSGVEVLSRVFAAGAKVLTAVIAEMDAGTDFALGPAEHGFAALPVSGAQHPTTGFRQNQPLFAEPEGRERQ